MLKKSFRFHGLGSLNQAYKHGSTVRGDGIALRYFKNPRRKNFRAAVVVAKKVHKSAVVRNRIRRKVYEAIKSQSKNLNSPYDLVFSIYNNSYRDMDQQQLEDAIAKLLRQAHVVS